MSTEQMDAVDAMRAKAKGTDPLQAEAEGIETVEVVWRDHTYTVPASPDDWPISATLALEEGKAATFVGELIGKKAVVALAKAGLRNSDLGDLAQAILAAEGVADQGE